MPNLDFVTGVLDGYFDEQGKQRDRREKNARDAANFLISTGRIRDYNDLMPIIDIATGGSGTGKGPKGFKAGVKAGPLAGDPHSILSQFLGPMLQANAKEQDNAGTTGTGGSGGSGGPSGTQAPAQSQPQPQSRNADVAPPGFAGSWLTNKDPGMAMPSTGKNPDPGMERKPGFFMSDEEMARRKTSIDIETGRALNAEDVRAIRERAQQFRTDDPTMSPQDAMAAAAETLGKKWPTVRKGGQPRPIGKPMDPAEDPSAKAENGQPFASVYPGVKGMQRMTAVGPDGNVMEYYTPAPAPAETKLPARLAEAVDEELAAGGIDPRTATTAQKNAALVGAGNRLRTKGNLDAEAERALIAARTRAGAGGALSQLGAVGPKGEELPQVSIGADGRPDQAQQTEFLGHFDKGTQAGIKGIADYTISPTTFSNRTTTAKGGGMTRAQMVELVKQFDPSYDETKYGQRNKIQTDWTSGKTRDAMVATNTVVRHLSELDAATKALAPYTWSTYAAINEKKLSAQAGFSKPIRDAVARFETARQAVASELERVYRGTGGSQADITEWRTNLSPYAATDVKQTALKTAVNLMFGRINSAVDNYRGSMGKNPPQGIGLTSSSMQVLRSMGIDPTGLQDAGQVPDVTPQDTGAQGGITSDRKSAVQYLRDHNLPPSEANIQHYLTSLKKPAA